MAAQPPQRVSRARVVQQAVGVDRVFLTAADGPDKVAHERAVVDAAAEAGVDVIVKLSALHADPGSPLTVFAWHGEVEGHLRRSGVPAVVLRPSFFMANLLMVAGAVVHTDTLHAPTGGAPVAMIDGRDVAAVAASVLVDDRYLGRTLELTGPAAVTFHDVAAALTAAVGRPIEYVDLTPEQARPRFEGAALPDWLRRHLAGVFGLVRDGAFASATGTVQEVLGHPGRDIGVFAADHVDAFSLAPAGTGG
ncbi:MAG: NmrA family NAD(P)-binding protein [Kineosporiaceae bacterium]